MVRLIQRDQIQVQILAETFGILEVNLNLLGNKQKHFISSLKKRGLANFTTDEYIKKKKFFSEISTNKTLRLCFYAIYDIELLRLSKDLIIIDWEKDGRKYYYPTNDDSFYNSWKLKSMNAIINNCNYGINTYSFHLIHRGGEAYPKNSSKIKYVRFYNDDWACWSVIGELHNMIETLNVKQDYKIVYAKTTFNCKTTVECVESKNNLEEGTGFAPK